MSMFSELPMKYFSMLMLVSFSSMAEIPNNLVCENHGSVNFWPESTKNKFDIYQSKKPKEDLLYISLEKGTSESTFDGVTLKEKLTKISSQIYLAEGLDEGKKYSGTFVFNSDFSLVSFSQDGAFASFYKCIRLRT